jgi:LysM repeat protein
MEPSWFAQVEEVKPVETAAPAPKEVEDPAPAVDDANTLTYTVQDGEDITDVSIRWGVTASAIRELNNLGENDKLKAGQVLRLPADAQQN